VNGYATATANITANVHAWVDESAGATALFGAAAEATLYTVDMLPNGDIMIGGYAAKPSRIPIAGVRRGSTGAWSSALNGFASAVGLVTHVSATESSTFLLTGLTGPANTNGNRKTFILHCKGSPAACTGADLGFGGFAAAGINGDAADFPVRPRIVSFSGFKYFSYTSIGTGCNSSLNSGLVFNSNNDLDSAFSAANVFTFGNESSASPPGNSCPFSPTATNKAFTGAAINGGYQLWVGGYADCGHPGCSAVQGYHGLVATSLGTGVWRTHQSLAVNHDIPGALVRRGYDDSLLAIRAIGGVGSRAGVLWSIGHPPSASGGFSPPRTGSEDEYGYAVAGAAQGGSAWAGAQPDLFIAGYRQDGASFFSSQIGTNAIAYQAVLTRSAGMDGFVILDVVLGAVGSAIEGWAIGHRYSGGTTQPAVFHLK
jgi:hypothetical protein